MSSFFGVCPGEVKPEGGPGEVRVDAPWFSYATPTSRLRLCAHCTAYTGSFIHQTTTTNHRISFQKHRHSTRQLQKPICQLVLISPSPSFDSARKSTIWRIRTPRPPQSGVWQGHGNMAAPKPPQTTRRGLLEPWCKWTFVQWTPQGPLATSYAADEKPQRCRWVSVWPCCGGRR